MEHFYLIDIMMNHILKFLNSRAFELLVPLEHV